MNLIKCEKLEKSMAELQFSIDAEAFKKAVADVFKKEGKKYPVQGFRKGKAPKALIEKMYGADVFTYDAINELFPEAFEAAVKEARYRHSQQHPHGSAHGRCAPAHASALPQQPRQKQYGQSFQRSDHCMRRS